MKPLQARFALLLLIAFFQIIAINGHAQPSPVACFPFKGDAIDVSGNNHHGIVTGATLAPDRFGNPNNAFSFDGIDDHIEISDSLGTYHNSNDLTICFWAKANSIWNNSPFFLYPNNNTQRLNIHIYYDNSGNPSTFWDYGNISSNGRLNIPNIPFQSSWQHYAFVINSVSDSMYVYRDGVLQGSKLGSSSISDRSRKLYIGGNISDVTNCHFNGLIDDVQIYDEALSQSDIVNDYLNSSSCLSSIQNLVRGTAFYDLNSNSIKDAGEPPLSNNLMIETNTGRPFFTFSNGEYIFGIDSVGTFDVEPQLSVSYYGANPISHTSTFTTIGNVDSLNDFALQPIAAINDLMISISALGPFRPGFTCGYRIHYKNLGTTAISATINLVLDTLLTFSNASITPSLVQQDTLIWNTPILPQFFEGDIFVYSILPASTVNGTSISSLCSIDPILNDANQYDNFSSWQLTSTGSYDPNDIQVDKTYFDASLNNNPPFLYYLIRFQNTGTDTAFTVIVNNIIPNTLNISSFQLLSASHNTIIDFDNTTREMKYYFNNILLPDSNTNEPLSHGSILYRIKPTTGLPLNTSIINNADIYFDFNAPVKTNDAITSILSTTSINTISEDINIQIFPNPAINELNIINNSASVSINRVEISDLSGRTVINNFRISSNKSLIKIKVETLSSGVYFLNVYTNRGVKKVKFIKN